MGVEFGMLAAKKPSQHTRGDYAGDAKPCVSASTYRPQASHLSRGAWLT
jgi:hypothetical protein